MDRFYLVTLATMDCGVVGMFASHSRWTAAACTALEVLIALALLAAQHLRPRVYLRHRSCLLGPLIVLHAAMRALQLPIKLAPTCTGQLAAFWANELLRQVIPWSAIFALCFPLPLDHAALAQACSALLVLSDSGRLRRLSVQLCPASGAHYASAARALRLEGTFFAAAAAGEGVPDGEGAYRLLTTLCVFTLSLLAPLELMRRRQRTARREFAAAHGLSAPATAELLRGGDQRAGMHCWCRATACWVPSAWRRAQAALWRLPRWRTA
ncbi:hypothetical protein ABPG75_013775 [Micractinium tetrahymenae]